MFIKKQNYWNDESYCVQKFIFERLLAVISVEFYLPFSFGKLISVYSFVKHVFVNIVIVIVWW